MVKSSQSDVLAQVNEAELVDFDQLDRLTQESLVAGLQTIADNPQVPQRDRLNAERRASAFRARMC